MIDESSPRLERIATLAAKVAAVSRSVELGELARTEGLSVPPEAPKNEDDRLLAPVLAAAAARCARAEQEQRESRIRREALDHLPTIVWVAGPSGDLTYVNARGREIVDDLLDGETWFAAVHPDDVAALRSALARPEAGGIRYRLRAKAGEYRWVLGEWTALGAYEEGVARVGYTLDIEAQKREEEGHRFVAEASEILASSLDDRTTLGTLATQVVSRLADWCFVDVARTSGIVRRVAVAHAEPGDAELAAALGREEPPRGAFGPEAREVLASTLPAEDLPPDLLSAAARLKAKSAVVVYALGVAGETVRVALFCCSDARRPLGYAEFALADELGRRTSHALERAHLYAEAQRANEAKDAFLATVSHELRGPLATISMWTHVLSLEHRDGATHGKAIDAIDVSVRAQSRLIEDMLDLSRAVAGRLRLDSARIPVARVIDRAVDRASGTAASKSVALVIAPGALELFVRGDEARLLQVLGNLLSNAIAFTPTGGRVDIESKEVPGGVRIDVRDTGEGMSKEFLPHLFEPFQQEDASLTRARGGLGLGLALAQQLANLHGGIIHAESGGRGAGALFAVELPLAPPDEAPPDTPPVTP
ncbi:MAG TPA: PAS domain-containing sensor histidine kinase [Polyangiaceae bacterium]